MSSHHFSLEGRIAWVTGGASGIGAAVVQELRACGATVCVTDRDEAQGVDACDMRESSQIAAYAQELVARHGTIDILVNNAGMQRRRQFVDFTDDDYADLIGTNVRGVFIASQAAAKAMVAAGRGGAIVNLSSVNATHAQPETALYCASKGAVATMTRALAVAWGRYGIRVNSVAPGTIVTGINRDRLAVDQTVRGVIATTAMGRLGVPEDVAPAVAFLASQEAGFITGASLAVHGGWTLTG